jgi:hypothetical protein
MKEDDIPEMLCNPIYAGLPPLFPQLVSEDQWINSSARLIRELGPETYLRTMLRTLRASIKVVTEEEEEDSPTS